MKPTIRNRIGGLAFASALILTLLPATARAQGTACTYRGWLGRLRPGKLSLRLLAVFCALAWSSTPTHAATRAWVGGQGRLWSNPSNWVNIATGQPGVPQNGDEVRLGDSTTTNDLTGLVLDTLRFYNHGGALHGNAIALTSGIETDADEDSIVGIYCPLVFGNGGTIVAQCQPGLFFETSMDLYLHGPITVNGGTLILRAAGTDLDADATARLHVAGPVSGAGNLFAATFNSFPIWGGIPDGCFVEFSGSADNPFTGTLTLRTLGETSIIFSKSSGVAANSEVRVSHGDVARLRLNRPNQFGPQATLGVESGGTLLLTGSNAVVAHLVLQNSAADVAASTLDTSNTVLTVTGNLAATNNSGSVTPALRGRLSLAAGQHNVTCQGSAYAGLDLAAQIIGPGGLNKTGSSALLLQTSNSFNGNILITQGTLDVRHRNALGDLGGDTTIGAGALLLRNVAIGAERLVAQGRGVAGDFPGSVLTTVGLCSWAGEVILNTNLVVTGDMTFSGPIGGVGGIGFFGGGEGVLGGTLANTYTGTTLVRNPLVQFNKPVGVKAFAGPLVVGGGALALCEARWIQNSQSPNADVTVFANGLVNLNHRNDDFGPVSLTGGTIATGAGLLGLNGLITVHPAAVSAFISGRVSLPSGFGEFRVADGSVTEDLQMSAAVAGSGSLRKTGTGQMWLNASNSYTGLTLVEQGTLVANHRDALGATGSGTIVQDGATLFLNSVNPPGELISLRGAGVGGTNGALHVVGSVTLQSQFPSIFACLDLTSNATILVESGSFLTANGFISGTGPLRKTGAGALTFSGSQDNTYTGETFVDRGTLFLSKSAGAAAVPGNLVIGTGDIGSSATVRQTASHQIVGNVTLNRGGLWDLSGNNEGFGNPGFPVVFNNGGSIQTGAGILYLPAGNSVSFNSLAGTGAASIAGQVALDAGTHVWSVAPRAFPGGPDLDVTATVFNSGASAANLTKTELGILRLGATNTYTGLTTVAAGTLHVDGFQPQSAVQITAGTLQGTGTVGNVTLSGGSAVLSPGASPGLLTCSNLSATAGGGTLRIELNGTTPATGYDQLACRGTINLSGISLNASLGFSSSVNDTFTIVDNRNRLASVNGTFNGLPDFATFYIGGELFQITYGGRSEFNVVLTRLVTPPLPKLAIERVSPDSLRLFWPTNGATGFNLLSNTNLSTTNWSAATPPNPVVVGTNWVVTNALTSQQKFYRLFRP